MIIYLQVQQIYLLFVKMIIQLRGKRAQGHEKSDCDGLGRECKHA